LCNFLQTHDLYYGWTSSFFDSVSSTFDWLLIKTFWILFSFEAEAFIGQSRARGFSLPQYKHKSTLRHQSFSFCVSFLKLEESICIGWCLFPWNNGFSLIRPLCRTLLLSMFKQSIVKSHNLYNGFYQY
jgi:hypothetical protein